MPIVTEIAYIPLQPDLELNSPSTPEGVAWSGLLRILKEAEGSQRVFWSRQVEHQEVLEVLIDWDNYAAFEQFPKTLEFQEFLGLLPEIAAGPPTIKNARFRSGTGLQNLGNSPVLEITTTYLPLNVDTSAYEKIVDSFLPILAQNTEGLLGTASGWVIEEQDNPVADAIDVKAKAFVVCLGWESIEAHMTGTRIPANKEAIAPWKAAIMGAEMHHLRLQS